MTLETLRAQVGELLEEPVTDDADLLEAGIDSIRLMTLLNRWQDEGHEVSFVDLAEQPTIAAWAELLR